MKSTNTLRRFLPVLLIMVLAGCAPGPNPTLDRMRNNYEQARQDPEVARYAPAALGRAGSTLSRAERIWQEDQDATEVEHLAYVADQQIAIARVIAERKAAEEEIDTLGEQLEDQLAEFRARETERGLMLTLGDVLFEVGQADLKPGVQRRLLPLADFLKQNPGRNVLVEGHTDNTGGDAFNQELSRRRAEAVANFLFREGIRPARITIRGYGEAYPVADNDSAAGRQQNRRVDVVILREGDRAADQLRG